METPDLVLLAPSAGRDLGAAVARALGTVPAALEERDFEDGEHKVRPLTSVRGKDVYLVQSLHSEPGAGVNDKLCKLLFLIGALVDAGAGAVTAVTPYLAYARKDRKTKPRDPVTTRYLAALLEAVGVRRVVTLDVHNPAAFQNAFRCATEHLEARWLLVDHLAPRLRDAGVAVVSPDAGGMKRAERLREALATRLGREIPLAFLEKHRSAGVVTGGLLAGDVRGRVAVIVDDLIATGTTLVRAARACLDAGAVRAIAVATHGLFAGGADRALADEALAEIAVTSTVPPFRLAAGPARDKLTVLDAAPLLAEAIARLHRGGSIVELVEEGPPAPRPPGAGA